MPDAQEGRARLLALVPDAEGAQRAYRARAAASRCGSDVCTSELAREPEIALGAAPISTRRRSRSRSSASPKGAQVEQVLGLRLNQALIGEMSSAAALNAAAKEIEEIFRKNGRKTGALPPLPERLMPDVVERATPAAAPPAAAPRDAAAARSLARAHVPVLEPVARPCCCWRC